MTKRVAVLGSTGSIGTQALDVCRSYPRKFKPEVLTASNNYELLIEQALEFNPNVVVIGNEDNYEIVQSALAGSAIKVFAGEESIEQIVEMSSVDLVLIGIVGFAGLKPTLNALKHGKDIAIANKEAFVVAGELVRELAIENHCAVIPVDSEHSAIFQCLAGENYSSIEKIILTASGGPFRGYSTQDLRKVTVKQALDHPNWEMGDKITIDSASMMNKGLEVIEAHWLFNVPVENIDVVIHPQSIIHSMVQFNDGSIKAQMGIPDMKLPIHYALSYPYRLKSNYTRFDFSSYPNLTFEKPNKETFRNLALAYYALDKAGNMPCVLNAANEIAVEAFLNQKVSFTGMSDLIYNAMNKIQFIEKPDINAYVETDMETRAYVKSII